eukprot:158263-Pelagomonas_calceolata.AAC.1
MARKGALTKTLAKQLLQKKKRTLPTLIKDKEARWLRRAVSLPQQKERGKLACFWWVSGSKRLLGGGASVMNIVKVWCPAMSDLQNLVEPYGAGITNTIGRSQLAAIGATLTHDYTHIATDSFSSLHQLRKQILYPEKHRHHLQGDVLKRISRKKDLCLRSAVCIKERVSHRLPPVEGIFISTPATRIRSGDLLVVALLALDQGSVT